MEQQEHSAEVIWCYKLQNNIQTSCKLQGFICMLMYFVYIKVISKCLNHFCMFLCETESNYFVFLDIFRMNYSSDDCYLKLLKV